MVVLINTIKNFTELNVNVFIIACFSLVDLSFFFPKGLSQEATIPPQVVPHALWVHHQCLTTYLQSTLVTTVVHDTPSLPGYLQKPVVSTKFSKNYPDKCHC